VKGLDSGPLGAREAKGIEVVAFEGSAAEWNGLLSGLKGTSFCHLGGWRAVMSDALDHELLYRVARSRGGETLGVLPLVRVRSRLFGDYLVSMPFLSYGGPVGTEEARAALATWAYEEASRLGVDLLELRSRTTVPGPLRTNHRKLTVILELPADAEVLWKKGLKAKVRSQIRRPMKEGMEARFGTAELDSFYDVFSRTMRELGTPVLPRAFFETVATELASQVVFCTVLHSGRPVAAGCGFHWDGEFEITWAGALRELSRLAPNMLLYWSLIEDAIGRGARAFNFGRCSPDSGTHRFKRQWGGEDHPLPWAQWSPMAVDSTPTPTGKKFELATALWRRIPLPLTNRLGPLISRSLP
jgi:FemAB-related protein (PEP-CTERM system-associated)